jgi:hypothetical protein
MLDLVLPSTILCQSGNQPTYLFDLGIEISDGNSNYKVTPGGPVISEMFFKNF